MDSKSKDWINEVKTFKNEQMQQIYENFEKSTAKLKDELEDSNMNLTKNQLKFDEEIQLKETYKNKLEVIILIL